MVKIKVMKDVMEANDALAQVNGTMLAEAEIFTVNMMSSPGSGKTTILERTIEGLGEELEIAVIVGDVYTARDAKRIESKKVQVIQINTGGACHLDASMVRDALGDMNLDGVDLLFIENVGNLVCPAGYTLGEAERVMVLSAPEGVDKPAKYPAMFRTCSLALLNKTDLLAALEMNIDEFFREIKKVNPDMGIIPMSARYGEGMEDWYEWLRENVRKTQAAL